MPASPDMKPVLRIRGLSVAATSHGMGHSILNSVDLDIPRGSCVALVGESGSGKSTLCNAILGLLPVGLKRTSGQILLSRAGDETDLCLIGERALRPMRGRDVAMAYQEPSAALSSVMTVGSMLDEMLVAHEPSIDSRIRAARIREILGMVGFPEPASAVDRYPFELSGGLRQRAMLASALICRPLLVIADEPTSALDVTVQALTLKLLAELQDRLGLSLLLVTHDLGVVANIADHVAVLKDGVVVEAGSVADVMRRPTAQYTRSLLELSPRLSGSVPPIVHQPVRSSATQALADVWRNRIGPDAGTRLISVESVSKRFVARRSRHWGVAEATDAVSGASLAIDAGSCVGLVGESGSGKSTLAKLVMRVHRPDTGRITAFDGANMTDISTLDGAALRAYRSRVQYVFQDPFSSLNPRLSAEDIITEPFVIHGLGQRRDRRQWALALMELVGLSGSMLDRFPNAFSGGQRQRLGIARALALGPDVLVCDEPVSALDVSVQAQILALLESLRQELNVSMLFVSHDLAVVRQLVQHVHVMCSGRIVEAAPVASLFANPQHPYTVALLAAHPEPDLDRKLDFRALMDGRASDPLAWPEPYRLRNGEVPHYKLIGENHVVAVAPFEGGIHA
jgi:peptide/nickel transport system ATP-binding protein